jgi:uncharacterized lipoprotein YddW (UPF0748 family)
MTLHIIHRRLLAACFFLFTCTTWTWAQAPQPEFRGAWVATVDQIDWPSKGNFNPEAQKAEFIALLDMHQRNGLNAVVVQIRPCADAFYPSPFEPWSQWLTGMQGKSPEPYYDPLEFMLTETHKRGMVFHAWLNPYRAEFNIGNRAVTENHITRMYPEWFVEYGGKRYFDPGNKEAQAYVVNVVKDIVRRYPVDGIHMDDYFYPYPISGVQFADGKTYQQYGKGMKRDDWRRSNTDSIIAKLHRTIKAERPACAFGISPFGVWRSIDRDPKRGSRTIGTLTNYDDLYADILLWLQRGWIDYVAPQLYWELGHKRAPFEHLIEWWSKNTYGKHLYIGVAIYRANSNAAWRDKEQLPNQMELIRSTPNVNGVIFYSSSSFRTNPNGWNDRLREDYFYEQVPVPAFK